MSYVPPHLRQKKTPSEIEADEKRKAEVKLIVGAPSVVIGLDQWAVASTTRYVTLCTSGIIGCVGLALISKNFVCLTHIYDGFEKSWDSYRHQLDLPFAVMRNVDQAVIVTSSHIHNHRAELLEKWLPTKLVNNVVRLTSNGVVVRKTQSGWRVETKAEAGDTYFRNTKVVTVAGSEKIIDNWGKLSVHASDSGA